MFGYFPAMPTHAPIAPHRPRLGFLYNHDDIHQVAHTAPLISPLQRCLPTLGISVLTSSPEQARAVRSHLDPALAAPAFVSLKAGLGSRVLERAIGGVAPLRRLSVLRRNRELLSAFDALVVPETTSTLLKTRFGVRALKLIYVPHGAGDRSVGFRPEVRDVDLALLSGEKVRDRMVREGLVRPSGHAVIGYPKFDAFSGAPPQKIFPNDRPVVLYNPHADPLLSSWYRFGEQVLDYFANQDRYNLVFAPHVMLFRRRVHASLEHRHVRLRPPVPTRFLSIPHLLVDLGSERSIDMTYTRAADVYLGDVSSQIYEFMRRPRPAFFLNAHDADWRADPNYSHWRLGEVLDDPQRLGDVLPGAATRDDPFREAQEQAMRETFSVIPGQSAGERGAEAIARFLAREWPVERGDATHGGRPK